MKNSENCIYVELMGGLGNMLFQIAATYSVAKRDNKKYCCNSDMSMAPHKHYSFYQNSVLHDVTFCKANDFFYVHWENGFSYQDIPNYDKSCKLHGYFQSERYFEKNKKDIMKLFSIKSHIKRKINKKYKTIMSQATTSIHVRRNDYVGLQNFHTLLNIEYYKQAVELIGNECLFLIFSDDINWCKENFNFINNKLFIEDMEDYEQLYLMSKCENNIIANSTFSWWAAWLNNNKRKQVIAPKNWFGPSNSHLDTKDLYPKKWTII